MIARSCTEDSATIHLPVYANGPVHDSTMEALEQWVYRVPEPPKQTRTKPMQILALGMSRSATESLSRALRRLGYDPVFHKFHMWQRTPMLWKPWTMLGRKKW